MKWFYNLKIPVKLIISFVIVAMVAGLVGVIGIVNIKKIDYKDAEMYKHNTAVLDDLAIVMQDYQLQRTLLRDLIISKDKSVRQRTLSKFEELDKNIEKNLATFEKSIKDERMEETFADLKGAISNFRQERDRVASLIMANQQNQAVNVMYSQGSISASSVQNNIEKLLELKVNQAKETADSNAASTNSAVMMMIVVIIIGMLLAIAQGFFLAKIIGSPLKKMSQLANKLAQGDLDVDMEATSKDEIGELINSFDLLTKEIKDLLAESDLLTKAALEGQLATRGKADKFQGAYRDLITGINNTLDAIVNPLNEAQAVLGRITVSDLTLSMTGQYKGMLREFAQSINLVQERLLAIQDIFLHIAQGDISQLEQYKKVGKRSENDKLTPAAITMMQTIEDLIKEVEILAEASINGELSIRGKADKFAGGYKEIIELFNKTLDAVVDPIQETSAILQEVAKGNLTSSMNGDYKGDYALIKDNLNFALSSFNKVLTDINFAAQQVASGSRQVSDSAQALSQGSTEQASSIEELTSSLEEISSQTKQNAANANEANQLAMNAKETAVEGDQQMQGMLVAMNEINESAGNIAKIIKVIDEIAFQTNILALNAAVEAARAGQHGKGFAVVAEEVRNLAARSANAAKETTVLIEGSIKKAEDGTQIANQTAEALSRIVEVIGEATSLVGEITNASTEQAAAIAQINQGILQVSQVVQTNSATSEESAAASEELSAQAEKLRDMVGQFKLNKESSTLNSLEDLNPEVLKMLDSMREKKRFSTEEAKNQAAPTKIKIALSDSEFGKY